MESQPNELPDEIDSEKSVIAPCYFKVSIGLPIKDNCEMAAIEQWTGTWVLIRGETPELRQKITANVSGISEGPYPGCQLFGISSASNCEKQLVIWSN